MDARRFNQGRARRACALPFTSMKGSRKRIGEMRETEGVGIELLYPDPFQRPRRNDTLATLARREKIVLINHDKLQKAP